MTTTPRDGHTARRTPLPALATANLSRLADEILTAIETRAHNFAALGVTADYIGAVIANVAAERARRAN